MNSPTLIRSAVTDTMNSFPKWSSEAPIPTVLGRVMHPPDPDKVRDRLIVALDVPSDVEAENLISKLGESVSFYKVGMELQLVAGINFVRKLTDSGKKVFLDGKWWDVPETVRRLVRLAVDAHVSFLTVHPSGKTVRAALEVSKGSDLQIFVVTVLTSYDESDVAEILYPGETDEVGSNPTIEDLVLHRSRKAIGEGCDGVIASGLEVRKIRDLAGDGLLIVSPGIRREGEPRDDHKRNVTPTEAIQAGADYLVVGKPIRGADDPRAEAERIIAAMESAWAPFRKRSDAAVPASRSF